MTIEVLTLFPEMLEGAFGSSILRRAQQAGLVRLRTHQLRDYAHDKHRTVDDYPFGGGPGMVLKPEPLVEAIEAIQALDAEPARVVFLTPEGRKFDQAIAGGYAALAGAGRRLLLVSGHYEGIDERVREGWIDEELSIGDYILTNGTIAALVVVDAVVRLIPGALGNEASAGSDSFGGGEGLLEGPQYTRPAEFRGRKVPEILMAGNHAAVEAWRKEEALKRTRARRNDLLDRQAGKENER
jgi:tRNA (guanine37-N1)-methyltransferase